MKKRLAILLVLSTLILHCSCENKQQGAPVTAPTQPTQQLTTEPTVSDELVEITQKPMYAVSLTPVVEETAANDGTIIFKNIYQNPTLILPEPDVAEKILLDLMTKLDCNTRYTASSIAAAQQAYVPGGAWVPHLLQIQYAPQRFDSAVLSFYGKQISYTGGAHAGISGESINYDLLTGNVLSLTDIFCADITSDTLIPLANDALSTIEEQLQLFNGYALTVEQILNTDFASFQNWYFSNKGLCIYFDPYEIAPFSSGVVTAEISYSKLTGILKDSYFPAETDPVAGTVDVMPFSEDALENFSQYAELVLNKGGTKFLLYTNTAVTDVEILAGDNDTLFTDSATNESFRFLIYTLTPGDAIMLEADISKTDLLISYQTGNAHVIKSIMLDGDHIIIK